MGLEDVIATIIPDEYGALPKDEHGENCNRDFNYTSIIGMILYLQGNSQCHNMHDIHLITNYLTKLH